MKTQFDEIDENIKHLISQENILYALGKEIEEQGYSGSTNLPQLIFICLYTRYLETPASLVIKGPSGSGKSYALNTALKFIPNDAYEYFSGMSEKALLYQKDLDLHHKFLVIGEAAGLAEGSGRVFLRQLLTEGSVRYATVQSTSEGHVRLANAPCPV